MKFRRREQPPGRHAANGFALKPTPPPSPEVDTPGEQWFWATPGADAPDDATVHLPQMTPHTPETGFPVRDADTALLLDGVRKSYLQGDVPVHALRGIDLLIPSGDYLAIMGPSGSGKSTLMHILGCLDVPTSGRYEIGGIDVSQMSEAELAVVRNERIGFVFQQFNLLASLTACQNVELPLVYAGVPPVERRRRAEAALEKVGLGARLQHKPKELSGGQQQRVAVARAVVTEPALILADEPTGNLDSEATEDVLALFAELHQQGRTIVLITHEHEVGARAQRMVILRDGSIVSSVENHA